MAHSLVAVLRDGATLPDGSEFKLYKPVIAAINGICAAGGMEMMWNTDLRVVADDTFFQLAEPRRGLFPGGGSTVHSARQLSWCNAMEVLLLADRITPERALQMGLVNAVVPRDQVMAKARELAEDHLSQRPARGARVQAVGEGEHVPRSDAGTRERDEPFRRRLHERGRQGRYQRVQGETRAGMEGPVAGAAMSQRSAIAGTAARRVAPLTGRGDLAIIAAGTSLSLTWAALLLWFAGTDIGGTELALRMTARASFVWFMLAFVASPLHQLRPSRVSAWLLRHRRALGVTFGLSMAIHVCFILRLFVLHAPPGRRW